MIKAIAAKGCLPLNRLGRAVLFLLREVGGMTIFFAKAGRHLLAFPFPFRKILEQTYFVGVKSIPIILVVGGFTGMVLGLQGYYTLNKFGSEGLLGSAVALSLIRELGPVLTALMIVARAGSSMAAEIGILRISEQIDALETMDIDPLRYLISSRIAAGLLCFPLLTALFNVVGIVGGYATGVILLDLPGGVYFYRAQESVGIGDVVGSFEKSLVFAVLVTVICCYQGFFTHVREGEAGAKGVSFATTSGVVLSCVAIVVADYLLTSFLL